MRQVLLLSIFLFSHILFAEGKHEKLSLLYRKIQDLQQEKKYTESLPYIQKYLSLQKENISLQLIYATSLLFRSDLPVIHAEDNVYDKEEKRQVLHSNYQKASFLFAKNISLLLKLYPPPDANLNEQKKQFLQKKQEEIAKYYFYHALSNVYLQKYDFAIQLFQKSIRHYIHKEAYYNIASLYEEMGKYSEARIYFQKYEEVSR
ncbi:MAG: tetratricopeptide repeat protein [Leptospiraceae bacterium]|nr:tetratricopeptide repeat protein [Leptospiraceae bacterium]